jgi:hypothetical protein
MRHPCKECGLSYRSPHNLEEHKRVGCVAESAKGESLIVDPDAPIEELITEELTQEVSPDPEPQA